MHGKFYIIYLLHSLSADKNIQGHKFLRDISILTESLCKFVWALVHVKPKQLLYLSLIDIKRL